MTGADALRSNVEALGVALATWATRDDSKAQPEVRAAANDAVDAIDALLAELHQCRQQLLGEIRRFDDAGNARVDALLDSLKRYRETGHLDIQEGLTWPGSSG